MSKRVLSTLGDKSDRSKRQKSDDKQLKKYSTRSDHSPITLEYELNSEDSIITGKVLSYNTSYVSDLALIKPIGTEAYMLSQIKSYQNRRHYMDKAIALIQEKFPECNIVLTQEAIDADKITYQEGVHDKRAFSDPDNKFIGGFQGIIKKLAGKEVIECKTVTRDDGSYYNKGTFGDHFYLAYSVQKILGTITVYPTVLTIWKNDLGKFENFYGKDLGIAAAYNEENENKKHKNIHHGRPFSCVRTNKGVTIINMHGPNGVESNPPDIDNKLRLTIIKYMEEAKEQFGSMDINLTILGGDLNDTNNELQSIDFNNGTLKLMGEPDKTCCYEALGHTQGKYDKYGDIVLVANPLSNVTAVYPYFSKSGISDADSSQSSSDEPNGGGRGRASYYTLNRKKKKRKKSIKKRHLVQYKTKTRKRKIKKTKTKKTKK